MPMTPPPKGSSRPEADAEGLREGVGDQPSGQTEPNPRKTAPVVQAVITEEQRQMEMDFGSQIAVAESVGVDDEAQMRSAVDGLDDMEAMLREGWEEKAGCSIGWRTSPACRGRRIPDICKGCEKVQRHKQAQTFGAGRRQGLAFVRRPNGKCFANQSIGYVLDGAGHHITS